MVPVSTQIAIVNPESRTLCHDGEYGEIWVDSEACVKSFYGSKDPFDAERFDGRTLDGDPNVQYVRTGDLGFLYNVCRPIGPNGAPVDMQVLFVLGSIGETFEINGLTHFPVDIERSVEKCHRNIVPGGCAIFQAGGLIVVLVEVGRKAYLASIVPVIVNAILNEHQIVVDIVAFVNKGDFPRSRLGEKQRGKILASWVTRKMRTMAQFGIRDADSGLTEVAEAIEPRASLRNSSVMGNSLRNVEPAPQIIEERETEQRQAEARDSYVSIPVGISEMPAQNYDDPGPGSSNADTSAQGTPGDIQRRHSELPGNDLRTDEQNFLGISNSSFVVPGFETLDEPPPRARPKPDMRQSVILPAVEGREGDLWNLPSQQTGGGLRVQNTTSDEEDDNSWKDDAIMHMNLAAG